ncbi:hypothetical protein AWB68_08807 [Caballeronia choica]|jgi:hypothetical protein|uniref:Uncharacterized protein n=1 Tax=Caballeronia choica TaxID=326476 RepID=A0A158L6M2_9BURK|nr:hypothetical protein AWB68_08807 [Caballeronia choica]
MTQVPHKHFGQRGKQWQDEVDPRLGARYLQRAGVLVKVLRLQTYHFAGAEAVGARHQQ